MKKAAVVLALFFILLATALDSAISQAHASGAVELVQSVPLETTLAVPGIRTTQAVWLEMIGNAKSTLDIEQFYINNRPGQSLEPVLNAVRAAAARGVRVRLIVDAKMFKTYPQEPEALSKVPNVQVRVIDFGEGIQHSKFLLVDGIQAYVGSANFDWLALSHIHEIGLHTADSRIADAVESVFARDWKAAVILGQSAPLVNWAPAPGLPVAVRLDSFKPLASPPSRTPTGLGDTLSELVRAMGAARTSIRIQVYQYSTQAAGAAGTPPNTAKWLALDEALRRAAARGVHVQLMVDAVALNSSRAELQALASVKGIEVRTVKIPEWSGGHLDFARLIHSKYLVIDGMLGWVGSENWSEGYFTNCRNVGLLFESAEGARQLGAVYDQVWTSRYASPL